MAPVLSRGLRDSGKSTVFSGRRDAETSVVNAPAATPDSASWETETLTMILIEKMQRITRTTWMTVLFVVPLVALI